MGPPPQGVGGEAMQGGEEIPAGNEMKGEASSSALGVPPLAVCRNWHVYSVGIEIVNSFFQVTFVLEGLGGRVCSCS